MKASSEHTLSGWEVRVDIPGVDEPVWLSAAEARLLSPQLLGTSLEVDASAALFASLPLKERVYLRLGRAPFHVPGGLAKLLGEPEADVARALDELRTEGRVEFQDGWDGFYRVVSSEKSG